VLFQAFIVRSALSNCMLHHDYQDSTRDVSGT
jgi:hypothetical protein